MRADAPKKGGVHGITSWCYFSAGGGPGGPSGPGGPGGPGSPGTGTGTGTTVVVFSAGGGAEAGTFWLHPISRSAAPASAVTPKYRVFMRTLRMLRHASGNPIVPLAP